MAEREQQFRIDVQKDAQAHEAADRKRGMYCGLAAFLSLVIGGVICAFLGYPALAGTFIGAGLVGAAGVFVHGRMIERKPIDEKPTDNSPQGADALPERRP